LFFEAADGTTAPSFWPEHFRNSYPAPSELALIADLREYGSASGFNEL
jgi:hypothetical protein